MSRRVTVNPEYGKWKIWSVDATGSPSHGAIENEINGGEVAPLQAEIHKSGLSGFVRVRDERSLKDAALAFNKASMFAPDDFELSIESMYLARSSTGTLDQWLDRAANPKKLKNPASQWTKDIRRCFKL